MGRHYILQTCQLRYILLLTAEILIQCSDCCTYCYNIDRRCTHRTTYSRVMVPRLKFTIVKPLCLFPIILQVAGTGYYL